MIKQISIALLALPLALQAQQPHTAQQSDPKQMGWMQGLPPNKDKIISAIDGSFFRFPAMRYSVCHMRNFLPTTEVYAALDKRYEFRKNIDLGIDTLRFTPLNGSESMTWEESLEKNYTDGIIILHKGRVVYERYFGELKPRGVHAVMSVSKTLTGTLGALLVAEGVLDEHKLASYYVPTLKGSAFGDATVRQILDMTTNLQYSEDYSDPRAEVWAFSAAGDVFSKPSNPLAPTNYYEYLVTVQKAGQHGKIFAYKTVNTDVLGWIISSATGRRIPELLSERIWQPLGTHIDGYYQVDRAGIAFAGGGFSSNLRDMAMFGEMMRQRGYFNGKQILPKRVVEEIMSGGDKDAFAKSSHGTSLSGWSYKNMWWVLHNEHGAFSARGVHGQTVYIDPMAEMVIVRFASHPEAKNSKNDPTSLPAYHAVAKYLISKKE